MPKSEILSDLTIKRFIDMSHCCIKNLGEPVDEKSAATKAYVDETVHKYTTPLSIGEGLRRKDGDISLEIPLPVKYGGTGVTNLLKNSILIGNEGNGVRCTPDLQYDYTSATLMVPNTKSSLILSEDLRTRRCSCETVSCHNLGVHSIRSVDVFSELLITKKVNTDEMSIQKMHAKYNVEQIDSKSGVELQASGLLFSLTQRKGQEEFQSDTLPSAKNIQEYLHGDIGSVVSCYYHNIGANEINLLKAGGSAVAVIQPGQVLEMTFLFTEKDSYHVFTRF